MDSNCDIETADHRPSFISPLLKRESENGNLTIKQYLQQQFWTTVFLHSVFLNYSSQNTFNSKVALAINSSYVLLLASLVAAMLYIMYLFAHPGDIITDGPVANTFVIICQILELMGVPLAIYYGSKPLQEMAFRSELETYTSAAVECLHFDAVFLVFVIFGYCLLPNFGIWFYVAIVFFEWAGTIGITISLFHVIVDARASVRVLKNLCLHADQGTLTMSMVRDAEVVLHHRSKRCFVLNTFIAVSALIHSATCILYVLFSVDNRHHSVKYLIGVGSVACAYFLKEVFYLVLALVEISAVNDLADALTLKMAIHDLRCEDEEDIGSLGKTLGRICIFNRLNVKPLSFKLLLARPTSARVLIQAIGYFTTLSISIILKLMLKF